jgi:thiol-disulfide isomerase/thioredoxin
VKGLNNPLMGAFSALLLVCASAGAGYLVYGALHPQAKPTPPGTVAAIPLSVASPAAIVGQRRPDFALPDYEGRMRRISEWDGKLVVLNFWATWCPPCVHEIPEFIALQTRYANRGVQFVGVAVDERDNVVAFAQEVGLNYPSFQDPVATLDLMRAYGNTAGGLPYTVLVSPAGEVLFSRAGPLPQREAESLILEHLPD